VGSIWNVGAGDPLRLTNPHSLGGSRVLNKMYYVMERPAWVVIVKFDSCNNLLSSVHTVYMILRSVKFDY